MVVAVFGGSLGARRINEATLELVRTWQHRAGLAVYHVVGSRDWREVSECLPAPPAGGLVYRAVAYEPRMPLLFAAAVVAVCRSGGTSVAELAAVGLPAVLVPLPLAPGDHQTANARVLEQAGAAVLVPDSELDGSRLVAEVDRLLGDETALASMSAAARSLARPGAADAVAALAEEHARG